jgi:hypothetical protein
MKWSILQKNVSKFTQISYIGLAYMWWLNSAAKCCFGQVFKFRLGHFVVMHVLHAVHA